MKRFYSLVLLVVLGTFTWTGCGVERRAVPSPVDIDSLLARAWSSYDALNFDVALARFDSVLTLLATDPSPYFGKGMILGFEGNYTQAHNFLNLSVFAAGQSGDLFVPSDTFGFSSSAYVNGQYAIALPTEKTPLVYPVSATYVLRYWYEFIEEDPNTGQVDTLVAEIPQYTPMNLTYFTTDTAFFTPPADTTIPDTADWPIPAVAPDSGFVFTDTIPYADRMVLFSYYYIRPGVQYETDIPILAYGANAGAYLAEEDFVSAMRNARVATLLKDSLSMDHYPYFTQANIYLIEAYSAFRLGLFQNAVDAILHVDPTWTPPEDPSDPDSYWDILGKLEALVQEYGTVF